MTKQAPQPAWEPEAFLEARLRMRLTQAELADRLGSTDTTMSRWENPDSQHNHTPKHPRVIMLAMAAIETGLDDLLKAGWTIDQIRSLLQRRVELNKRIDDKMLTV